MIRIARKDSGVPAIHIMVQPQNKMESESLFLFPMKLAKGLQHKAPELDSYGGTKKSRQITGQFFVELDMVHDIIFRLL